MSQPLDVTGLYPKVVRDPVHGNLVLEPDLLKIVDTPQFQRLRDLKQLGLCYLVWPGASHNRFEHSLGVCHLAGEMAQRFQQKQPELGIDRRDLRLVKIAGLCHDLGHGPFSHPFEEFLHRINPCSRWSHEEMSCRLLEYTFDHNNLWEELSLETEDLRAINSLILGVNAGGEMREKPFLYDIVANKRNGVDVDKFDYLARDCLNLGMKGSCDFTRLMMFTKVIDNEVCFAASETFNLYEMFHTRYTMHKQVYTHRVVKGLEYMIQDSLIAATPYLNLVQRADHPHTFWQLTDTILRDIEFSSPESTNHDPGMEHARNIVEAIRRRNLYKCVGELLLSDEEVRQYAGQLTAQDIVNCQDGSAPIQLFADDLIINRFCLNYSMKNLNPVDNIRFYTHWESHDKVPVNRNQVSLLIPDRFQEDHIRVYVRDVSPFQDRKCEAARLAFNNWRTRRHVHAAASITSPSRPRKKRPRSDVSPPL